VVVSELNNKKNPASIVFVLEKIQFTFSTSRRFFAFSGALSLMKPNWRLKERGKER